MPNLSSKNKSLSFVPVPQSVDRAGLIKINSRSAGVPSGWLECNGQAVSRSTYAELFAAVGTDFGVGDGSTTFNLPTIAAAVADTEYIIKAYTDNLGVSVEASDFTSDTLLLKKTSERDLTIADDYAMIASDYEIASGHSFVVSSDANMDVFNALVVNGTLTVNGLVTVR